MAAEKKYRYPGLNSFETEDTDIFFGREEDRRKLADLVEVEKNVLLYSRSGLGKSSLLKAALMPELLLRGYQPFYIRLGLHQPDSLPPVQNVLRRTVLAGQKAAPVTFLHKFVNRTNSLWSVFKAAQIHTCATEKPVVLIFDQFEEISSYRQHLADFRQQLSELLYATIPQQYLEALTDEDLLTEPLTDTELEWLYKPLRIKAIFSIRSDQLSVMNELSDYIPNILKVYYELKPLTVAQAHKAIIEPGKKRTGFVTLPFVYQADAIDTIIRALNQKDKNEIDTAQLQILLQHVEQDVVERQQKTDIAAADLGNVSEVYRNYYHNSLLKLEEERDAAEELIEDTLIAEGRRVSYDEALCRKRISATTLDTLMKVRLLRQEPNTMGGYSYEISHDSLVEPILQTREERKRREAEAAQQAAFAAQLTEQRKKAARQRLILYIAAAAVLLSAGFAAWAVQERNKANKANNLAQQNLAKADKLINAFYFYDGKFAIALKKTIRAENRFYFIDTTGNPVEKLGEWEKAEQFDFREGLAKVQNGGIDYLLDTFGNASRVAYDTALLNETITALDLSDKRLERFPHQILQNEQLRVLKLKGIGIPIPLPDGISHLKNLTHLHLSDCRMENLTEETGNLRQLNFLDISKNNLTALPENLPQLARLTMLDASINQLNSLPGHFTGLQNLTFLDLSTNRFSAFPNQLTGLLKLKALYLNNNQLPAIPREVNSLAQLTILGLSNNRLNALPPEMGSLHLLNALGVNNNQLVALPDQITQLQNLTELNCSYNRLTKLPEEIGRLSRLTVLGANGNRLTAIPFQIGALTKLMSLDLSENNLQTVPVQIENLKELVGLGLSHNSLKSLPAQIGALQSLQVLHLDSNRLSSLPVAIGDLKRLTELTLWNNRLTALPEQITDLNLLKTLDVSDNELTELPDQLGKLTHLTVLDVSNNRLTTLPASLKKLTVLRQLTLFGNRFSDAEKRKIGEWLPDCTIEF